jgi:hypothetical protein
MLYITEYSSMAIDGRNSVIPAPITPPLAEQCIEVGLSSTESEPFQGSTKFIAVSPDEACCIAFGVHPEATNVAHRIFAGETRYYGVHQGHRLAVIAAKE